MPNISGSCIPTGLPGLDAFLNGGLTPGKLYHIFGASGSGKTTLALQTVKNDLDIGGRVIWVETERKNFLKRLSTMMLIEDFEKKLSDIIVFPVSDFKQQGVLVNKLADFITHRINLVVFDTITHLYRGSLQEKEDNIKLNKEINRQIALVKSVCITKNITCIMVNHVRLQINSEGFKTEPVACKIITYWSDFNIELTNLNSERKKLNIVSKEGDKRLSLIYELTSKGVEQVSRI
ncbi:MAG: ATPase domain-containing protein [Candidatus Odinarchaeota archaeon]